MAERALGEKLATRAARTDQVELARELASSGRPWFWLEYPDRSYLGLASEVRLAELGREREFLSGLRAGGHAADQPDLRRGSPETRGTATFSGGWVVALGYEFGVALLGEQPAPDDAHAAFALRVGEVNELPPRTARGEARETAEAAPRALASPVWRRSNGCYLDDIESCKRSIIDGDAYVLCLTDTARRTGIARAEAAADPLSLYLSLRGQRGAVIVAGDRALVSKSPERFLSVRGSRIETHPIKGTRARGGTPERDAALAAELATDPKERAENLMIVDLMRNDLSRICEPGTVATEGFLRVESHPHAHQLVSTVAGRLAVGRDVYDGIAACLPGGSMTGAPKRRAVQLLAELEGAPRGLYSGCHGWIGDTGDAELAMTIRGVELRGLSGTSAGVTALVGAGGGITADSIAQQELRERDLKAAPLLAALAALQH